MKEINLYFIKINYGITYYKILNEGERSKEWYCKCCDESIYRHYPHKKVRFYELIDVNKNRCVFLIGFIMGHLIYLIYKTLG